MKETFELDTRCFVCGSGEVSRFIEINQAPVHCNLLWSSHEEAVRAPRGDIQLGFCKTCGFIFNLSFDPELIRYSKQYENSLHYSPLFQDYARSIAGRLVQRYDLYDKDIIEIGSGKGDFLRLLCKLGNNRGVGFDPGFSGEPGDAGDSRNVTFIQDFYSQQYAHYRADLICSRHTLEHIHQPREFMTMLRASLGERIGAAVFFEVPNMRFTLQDLSIWDIIYEHCSYFGSESLANLFNLSGFEILKISPVFKGQFLTIEARAGSSATGIKKQQGFEILDDLSQDVAVFAQKYRQKLIEWQNRMERIRVSGKRAVIWGAGSKGVSFLNTLHIQDEIQYVVDINPNKHEMYVAGSGQKIVPPDFLIGYSPDLVIVMNAIYNEEIRRELQALGQSPVLMNA